MILATAVPWFLAGFTVGGVVCYELGAKWGARRYGWRK